MGTAMLCRLLKLATEVAGQAGLLLLLLMGQGAAPAPWPLAPPAAVSLLPVTLLSASRSLLPPLLCPAWPPRALSWACTCACTAGRQTGVAESVCGHSSTQQAGVMTAGR